MKTRGPDRVQLFSEFLLVPPSLEVFARRAETGEPPARFKVLKELGQSAVWIEARLEAFNALLEDMIYVCRRSAEGLDVTPPRKKRRKLGSDKDGGGSAVLMRPEREAVVAKVWLGDRWQYKTFPFPEQSTQEEVELTKKVARAFVEGRRARPKLRPRKPKGAKKKKVVREDSISTPRRCPKAREAPRPSVPIGIGGSSSSAAGEAGKRAAD